MNNDIPSIWERAKVVLLYLLPHHIISRAILFLTRLETSLKNPLVRGYIKYFRVDMNDAVLSDPEDYPSFDSFFTRKLKPEIRPVCDDPKTFAAPCDGTILEIGDINDAALIQAKDKPYTVGDLLGCEKYASLFQHGKFCSLYLSPRDYHRVHIPADGQLETMIHIPGRLFSVAPYALQIIPRLYIRNERVVSIFTTPLGSLAVIMVGAINVGCIETSWHGIVAPSSHRTSRFDYMPADNRVYLKRGEEMGCFHLGSSVIVLSDNPKIRWNPAHPPGSTLLMGEELAAELDAESEVESDAKSDADPDTDSDAESNVAPAAD